MSLSPLERILRRDRMVVAAALLTLAVAAWAYILMLARRMDMSAMGGMDMGGMDMGGMDMGTMDMGAMLAASFTPWSATDFLFMFVMWAVMMVGMMIPSASPMILIYARVARQAQQQGKPFAATAWFFSGYLIVWAGFSLAATLLQWGLEYAALLTPMMASASPIFGGIVLIAAGLYQWTPIKDACLSLCQAPFAFIQRHGGFRRDVGGSLALGMTHGVYCVGCCWALMALLFVGGVMNLLWVAGLALFVLVEKVIPAGRILSRAAGVVFIAVGVWMILS